ncbi:unnamed protein product [Sordaria macrospora k-hell]|uniref:WGS project CABT00000000 data, contig 2.10 n=1 Tax=Sordaria macrospora (strain ATCC MYA-333 / DSM 997 / K(L3346) / K-hell) TaxID=771870 RepID=F7VWI5_SORMK|nr:uncharacterized protein SMAC_03309 [Sordaria macrospora k-hell]CCC09753.1 unnamed protein product [Sordaria macrospora k-hell]
MKESGSEGGIGGGRRQEVRDKRSEFNAPSFLSFPSKHGVHYHQDPEGALPPTPAFDENESISWTDLPSKTQLLILSLCGLSSRLSNVLILPYLFHLVRSAVSTSSTLDLSTDNDDFVAYYTSIPTTALASTYAGVLVAAFRWLNYLFFSSLG